MSDRKSADKTYIKNQPMIAQKNVIDYIEECGFTFEDASKYDYVRYIINIKYLMDWAKNYKYRGGVSKKRLF